MSSPTDPGSPPPPGSAQDLDSLRSEGDINLSPNRQAWAGQHLGAETKALLEEDARLFLHQSLSTPCLNVLKSAHGARLVDHEDRSILDFHGNNVHQVGFGHPRVIEALTRQLAELPFCPRRYTCEPAIELARELTRLAPDPLKRVLFSPGGTSAMGMALKLARAVTGRHKTISMWESFHGASLDCISIGGEAIFRRGIGPLLPGCEHVPPPDPRHCPFRCGETCSLACADYVDYVLEREGDVAAVIAETVRCTPFIPPPDYWRRVRAACDRHGALLILDEIPIGLGRTGRFFAFEHYGVVPDMVVLGKGLGGGLLPIAALIAKEEFNKAYAHAALGHYTHEKNPVSCAVALATVKVIQEEGLLERTARLGATTLEALNAMVRRHPGELKGARGLGLLMGLELRDRSEAGIPGSELAERVLYGCLRRGLSFKITMGTILTLTPALTISEEDLQAALRILEEALVEARTPRPSG